VFAFAYHHLAFSPTCFLITGSQCSPSTNQRAIHPAKHVQVLESADGKYYSSNPGKVRSTERRADPVRPGKMEKETAHDSMYHKEGRNPRIPQYALCVSMCVCMCMYATARLYVLYCIPRRSPKQLCTTSIYPKSGPPVQPPPPEVPRGMRKRACQGRVDRRFLCATETAP